jgi:hypothetical protein
MMSTSMTEGEVVEAAPPRKPDVDPYRRVKIYELNSHDKWDDRGTGHVKIIYDEVCFDVNTAWVYPNRIWNSRLYGLRPRKTARGC